MSNASARRASPARTLSAAEATGYVATWAGVTQVVASPRGLLRVHLPDWHGAPPESVIPSHSAITQPGTPESAAHLAMALHELTEYFAGTRRGFTVALDPQGPAFHRAAWEAVARVPYGETRSYLDIARELGDTAATRAVGMANGANPLAPIVPCHRIVGSDGRLTGYGPGMALKRRLLAMEGAMPLTDADYDAWAEQLPAGSLLGVRANGSLCRPTCARAWRYADRCPRIFASLADGVAAGFTPCTTCQSATPSLAGMA